eukprot:CCRYP_008607-RA/>CCRYP_008607-RA protein AED:0.37 eAED:0.38 QI:0/0/0/1/0/0/2/0/208
MELHGSKKTPSFKEFDPSRSVSMSIFLKLFPWKWLCLILLVQKTRIWSRSCNGENSCATWGFGSSCLLRKKDFWSTIPFDERTNPCPYSFRKYMSSKRFDGITAALSFTNLNKPTYRDKFWEVWQLIAEWNKNMAEAFLPGKSTGECEAITGTLNASPYFIWGMKEPDYVMKIMATVGVLEEDETCRMTFRGSGYERTSLRLQVQEAF